MEPAGVGALLAQLERLKARLKDEGLFDPARKRALPPSPSVIGVITSPTGAVIRDILHRVRDRWPAHLLVWPVVVQGPEAALQVANAVRGFNALVAGGPIPRPDLLIVARGGGSVEDLWPFNDEALARAVFEGSIPLISAVGHETDTTLIDFVSDRRAPTPTAAAEMATPVLAELRALVFDYARRMTRCAEVGLEHRRQRLQALSRGLPRPDALLGPPRQRFDLAAGRLSAALERNTAVHGQALARAAGRLSPSLLRRPIAQRSERLSDLSRRLDLAGRRAADLARTRARLPELEVRLDQAMKRRLAAEADRLGRLDQLRRSLDPNRPLELGFARVHRADGALVRTAASLHPGDAVSLVFADDQRRAVIDGSKPTAGRAKPSPASQRDLF
jgi:exodeoxyribonuclease VII large subunit